jgi:glutamate synthase domain-containing protein 1
MTRDRSRPAAPLYDPTFEHDACGIGFVADAGGRRRHDVVPLALGGLAALGHRGAFGADGESSDGAGIALPLEAALLELIAGQTAAGDRPGVSMVFLPRSRGRAPRARRLIGDALAAEGLGLARWRRVPTVAAALGAAAASSRPDVAQAVITRPADPASGRPLSDAAFDLRLVVAGRVL